MSTWIVRGEYGGVVTYRPFGSGEGIGGIGSPAKVAEGGEDAEESEVRDSFGGRGRGIAIQDSY